MPNLKEEILDLLKAFPPSNTEGKTFEALLDDLAEDIQAAVIGSMVPQLVAPNHAVFSYDVYQTAADLLQCTRAEAKDRLLQRAHEAGRLPNEEETSDIENLVSEMANDVVGATVHNLVFLAGYAVSPELIRRMLKPLAVQQLANQGLRCVRKSR